MINDVEQSMGNTELRLTLATIQEEIGDVKGIALETREQAKKTNGRVNLLEKFQYAGIVGLGILTPITGWLAADYLNHRDEIISQPASQEQIQAAVAAGISQALQTYNK